MGLTENPQTCLKLLMNINR